MKNIKTRSGAFFKVLLLIILPLSVFGKMGKKVRYIELPPLHVDTVEKFSAIRIIDFRPVKDTIGIGSFGGWPATIAFRPPQTFNSYLLKHVVFKKPKNQTISKDTLVIALYAYCVNIDLLGRAVKAFHFDADCYVGGNGQYRSAGNTRVYREVRDYHLIADDFVSWMTDSVLRSITQSDYTLDKQTVDEQFILNGRAAEFANIPAYRETIKDGLYATVNDFLNNTPSETGAINWILSDKLDFNLISADGTKTRMKSKDFFVICDKGHLYKADGGINIGKVIRKGNEYYFGRVMMGLTNHMVGYVMEDCYAPKYYYCKIDFRTGKYYQVLELDDIHTKGK